LLLLLLLLCACLQVLGKGGANMGTPGGIGSVNVAGLLTNGPGGSGSGFGAAGASFSSFYAGTASNADGTPADGDGAAGGASGPEGGAGAAPTGEEGDDGANYDPLAGRTRGLGCVFLEFASVEGAVASQKELSGRAFNGRILVTSFAHEGKYAAGEVCDFAACK